MAQTYYEAGGFAFPDENMQKKAVKEEEGIRYIRNSADMNDPQMIFRIYCQMAEQRLFETPVGYSYLFELREYLKVNPSFKNIDIPAIPVAAYQTGKKKERADRKESQTGAKIGKNIDYKPRFRTSVFINIILLLIVIGMFAVTATSGNINIVNYENALIEKYEKWEIQLKEREEKLNERERKQNDEN